VVTKSVADLWKKRAEDLEKDLQLVEKKMKEIIFADPDLKLKFELLIKIPGIGEGTVTAVLAEVTRLENFRICLNPLELFSTNLSENFPFFSRTTASSYFPTSIPKIGFDIPIFHHLLLIWLYMQIQSSEISDSKILFSPKLRKGLIILTGLIPRGRVSSPFRLFQHTSI